MMNLQSNPHMKPLKGKPLGDAVNAYHSEEFKAFCRRFGIAWGARTKVINIKMTMGGEMIITQEYGSRDLLVEGE